MATKKLIAQVTDYSNTIAQIEELTRQLKKAGDHKAALESAFGGELADGMHPAGQYILEVATKTKKGRKSTSWKSVAEGVSETLPGITEALAEAFPAEVASFRKFEAEATALHDDLLGENTKVGPDSNEKVIQLHETAGKADKKAEAKTDEPEAAKPRRKHQLRVAG